MNKVIIVRGIPGSGKTTFIRKVLADVSTIVCSADNFRYDEKGNYIFNKEDNSKVHELCFQHFTRAIKEKWPTIVVDNTNVKHWEWEKYEKLAEENNYTVFIISMKHPPPEIAAERNTHNVPVDTIQKMIKEFEA